MENGERKRVLRPRRNVATKVETGEHRSFGERKRFSNDDRRPGRSYGNNEGRSFSNRPSGRPSFRNNDRKSFGEGGDFRRERQERSFHDSDRRPARSFGGNSEGRSFSNRPSGRSSFRNNDRKSFGEGGDFRRERQERPFRGGDRRQTKSFSKPFNKSFGNGSRTGFKKQGAFRMNDESGINKMIDRKPIIDNNAFSDNDIVNIPVKEVIRLNKFIANSGVCSRREADSFIQAGVVTVNGEIVTELGTKVNIYTDDIRFNGERLKGEDKVYIVMNKPKGFVTTASDPHADKTVMDLLTGCQARVFPVGRLDKNTTGVLMFTNDGEIAEKLTHPSYDKKKIYQVTLDHDLKQSDFDTIMSGVILTDGEIAADDLEFIDEQDHRKIGIEIHSGKNRIVRRIFETLGYEVKALDRVYFAGLTKRGIKRGGWRYLSEGEVNILKMGAYK